MLSIKFASVSNRTRKTLSCTSAKNEDEKDEVGEEGENEKRKATVAWQSCSFFNFNIYNSIQI